MVYIFCILRWFCLTFNKSTTLACSTFIMSVSCMASCCFSSPFENAVFSAMEEKSNLFFFFFYIYMNVNFLYRLTMWLLFSVLHTGIHVLNLMSLCFRVNSKPCRVAMQMLPFMFVSGLRKRKFTRYQYFHE